MFYSNDDASVTCLLPHVRFFTTEESLSVRRFMYNEFSIDEDIDWNKVSNFAFTKDSDEILPLLKSLCSCLKAEEVYLFWNKGLPFVALTSLENILSHYALLKKDLLEMWIWSPRDGFIIEDMMGDIRLGTLLPTIISLSPQVFHKMTRDSFPHILRPIFYRFLASYGIIFIDDITGNREVDRFLEIFPITPWGNIDWDFTEDKIQIAADFGEIYAFLDGRFGKELMDVFVLWRDPEIPIVKIDFCEMQKHFRGICEAAHEVLIFNPVLRYVIEVRFPLHITVGVFPK